MLIVLVELVLQKSLSYKSGKRDSLKSYRGD